MASDELFPILDEQVAVGFTGKINALDYETRRLLGAVEMREGEIFNARYKDNGGLKAFLNLCVDSFEPHKHFVFVVEPEVVDNRNRIHFPYSVLKRKAAAVISLYKENKNLKPPEHLKLLANPDFIFAGEPVEGDEFELLCAISDHQLVKDVYKNCQLLDYQITNGLVSLRKKKAITVIGPKK